jgi:hypothetical protein
MIRPRHVIAKLRTPEYRSNGHVVPSCKVTIKLTPQKGVIDVDAEQRARALVRKELETQLTATLIAQGHDERAVTEAVECGEFTFEWITLRLLPPRRSTQKPP